MLALQGKLIARAAEIVGGMDTLCDRLGVQRPALHLWLQRKALLPDRIFILLTDIILKDDIARAAQDRRRDVRTDEPATLDDTPPRPGADGDGKDAS